MATEGTLADGLKALGGQSDIQALENFRLGQSPLA
jgi:hypothetical protein